MLDWDDLVNGHVGRSGSYQVQGEQGHQVLMLVRNSDAGANSELQHLKSDNDRLHAESSRLAAKLRQVLAYLCRQTPGVDACQ